MGGPRLAALLDAAGSSSYAGGTVTYVAAPILVYALTGSALLTGVTAATEGLPYLLFGLVAGALADRVNRQRLMVVLRRRQRGRPRLGADRRGVRPRSPPPR